MTENKSFAKNPLFIGNTIFQLVNAATSALYANWITCYSKDGYNLTLVISSIIGIVISLAFSIEKVNSMFCKVFHFDVRNTYNKFVKFLFVEGLANLLAIFITAVTKTPLGAIIISIVMTPLSKIQAYSVNELASKVFNSVEKRKEYDDFLTTISPFINAIGFTIGFAVNHLCDGASAYILLCVAEVVNNIFYYRAYKSVEDIVETEEYEEETADEEEVIS